MWCTLSVSLAHESGRNKHEKERILGAPKGWELANPTTETRCVVLGRFAFVKTAQAQSYR